MTGNSIQTNLGTTVYSTVEVALHGGGKKRPYISIKSCYFLSTNEEIHGPVSMHRQIEQRLVLLYPDFCCKKGKKKLYDEY